VIVVLMGFTGTGKSTLGRMLAETLGWTFVEGDDFHPTANIEKMRQGIPLTDDDRKPWLDAIRKRLDQTTARGEDAVLACSALKHSYQHYLAPYASEDVRFVYLRGSEELIRHRLATRAGHFMNPMLLESQFEALEPPEEAVLVDVGQSPEAIVTEIRSRLGI
jgi:gluconokinase